MLPARKIQNLILYRVKRPNDHLASRVSKILSKESMMQKLPPIAINRSIMIGNFYVLKNKKKLIGILYFYGAPVIYLDKVWISKSLRGKGYGRLMVKYAIHRARKQRRRMKVFFNQNNRVARRFYKSLGFTRTLLVDRGKYILEQWAIDFTTDSKLRDYL